MAAPTTALNCSDRFPSSITSMKLHGATFQNGTGLPLHAQHPYDMLMTPGSYFMQRTDPCIHHTSVLVHNVSLIQLCHTVTSSSSLSESLFLQQPNCAEFRGASSWSNDALLTSAPHQLALKLPSALRLCTKAFTCCLSFYRHYRQTTGMYKWSAKWFILSFEEWNSQALFFWVDISSKAINEVCVRQAYHSGWDYKLDVIA